MQFAAARGARGVGRGAWGVGGDRRRRISAAEISERKTRRPDLRARARAGAPEELRINLARGRGHSNECLTLMGFAGPPLPFSPGELRRSRAIEPAG